MVGSGNCRGVGEKSEGMLRPRGPSGDDCNESVAGLAVDEVPLGVAAGAGVTVNGTDVFMYCLDEGCADGVETGDDQHLLLLAMLGDEFVAVGAMLRRLGAVIHWFASGSGVQSFSCRFEWFRRVVCRRLSCAVDDGGV